MKIRDIIESAAPTLSFEFFPPKDELGFWDLHQTIEKLKPLDPSFISVTYGAGGSTRRHTVALTKRIQTDMKMESLAHLTCLGHSRREIAAIVDELKSHAVGNILALRGDPPVGQDEPDKPGDGFDHADELVAFIRDRHDVCVGGACHPETHPQAPDPETDLDHLKRKVDAGCDFLISQLFFDNDVFYRFRDRAVAKGIAVPIIAGIMPVLGLSQIRRFTQMCGATIPKHLLDKIEAVEDDPEAVRHLGTFHATEQCQNLLDNNVSGIHFYTLNRSTATRAIYQHIKARVIL